MLAGVALLTLARDLGVSRATVSNAYNHPDQLSPALRARILPRAAEHGLPAPIRSPAACVVAASGPWVSWSTKACPTHSPNRPPCCSSTDLPGSCRPTASGYCCTPVSTASSISIRFAMPRSTPG